MLRPAVILAVAIVVVVIALLLRPRGALPVVGSNAPDFSLPSQEGTIVNLQQYRGRWVVLYFYPKDQTYGCTREARNFAQDQNLYTQHNAVVLGVSLDTVNSHQQFCAKEGLNFKLLSDSNGTAAAAYGSLTNLVFTKIAARHTFIIDPTGKIAKSYSSVDPVKHSAEVLVELGQLQKTPPSLPPTGS